ncbi:reverse transcriptase domain-containing protein [Tanacetum coccineum]|uniref:Reverse transcriptase domain-containing protein n=1 Tax=Tanacetum coccineum TaxID=301880 RepID=A0ABQ4X6C2_9ASTR
MRTRNSYFPNNSNVTIPRRRNKGRAPNIVEPELRTIVAPMAERTMEELLRAPTEGYGEAIVLPEINADHFEIKTNLLQLVQANPFYGRESENPHAHINSFKRITSTLRFRNVPNDVIKLMMFPYSLEGAAKTWYEKEPPNSILTWEDLVTKFVNQFFPPSKTTHLKNEISRFTQKFEETFSEAWERFKELLRACPHHGFTELTQVDTFYNGLNENEQDSLNAAAGGNLLNQRKNLLSKFNSLKQELSLCKYELVELTILKSNKSPSHKVTLDQLLNKKVPGNIICALEGRGKRNETISSKEVVFTKADESPSKTVPEITSNSESECDTQELLPPFPKLSWAEPISTSADKADSSTEKLLLTLMEEVKGLKEQIKPPSYNSVSVSQTGSSKSTKGDIKGYGLVNCNEITFTRVAYVNGLKHNLISISQLCDANFKVLFTKLKEPYSTKTMKLYLLLQEEEMYMSLICHLTMKKAMHVSLPKPPTVLTGFGTRDYPANFQKH